MKPTICSSHAIGLTVLLFGLAPSARGGDWPSWRGPNHDGVSTERGWFKPWPAEGPRQLWKTSVGTGFSSVALSQGRLFTVGNTTNTDTVFCFDADSGALTWSHSYACPLDPNLYEGGPNATPTAEGDRVYTLSKRGHAFCFEAATGKIVWQKNLMDELGVTKPEWGFASSPLIQGTLLLLNVGEAGTALEKVNGKVAWSSGKGPAAYSTPLPFAADGKPAVVFLGHRELLAVTVADGAVLWRMPWKTGYDMNIPDPVLYQGRFFVSTYDRPGSLLEAAGGKIAPLWQNPDYKTHASLSVRVDDCVYGFHGDANRGKELKCLDLKTGQIRWTQEDLPAGALLAADGKLIILAGKGELIVAEATPAAFKPLARAQVLGGKCWTVPVLAQGKLYCRSAKGELICLAMTDP